MSGNLRRPLQPDTTPSSPAPDSAEYWQQCRDAGNEARHKAGLPELPPNWWPGQPWNKPTPPPTPLQPTPLELALARPAIREKKLQDEARELQNEANRALIRHLAENTSSRQKNSVAKKKSTPGPDPRPAIIEGARLYGEGKLWPTILLQSCKLIPDFSAMEKQQQYDVQLKLRKSITQYAFRHDIHRPQKKIR